MLNGKVGIRTIFRYINNIERKLIRLSFRPKWEICELCGRKTKECLIWEKKDLTNIVDFWLIQANPWIFHINFKGKANGIILASQAKPSQAKPSNTYYQMDISSFAKGGISRLQTPFLVKDSREGVFCFDRIYRMNNRKPQRRRCPGERKRWGERENRGIFV